MQPAQPRTSAPGSKSPLGRGGEAAHRALGVLSVFPVVSVRLCAVPTAIRTRVRGAPAAGPLTAGCRFRMHREAVWAEQAHWFELGKTSQHLRRRGRDAVPSSPSCSRAGADETIPSTPEAPRFQYH